MDTSTSGFNPFEDEHFTDTLNYLIAETPDDDPAVEATMNAAALIYAAGSAFRNGLPREQFLQFAEYAYGQVVDLATDGFSVESEVEDTQQAA